MTDREQPAPEHRRPDGVDDATVDAVGRFTKALETAQRARGHLYGFHQLTGEANRYVEESIDLLEQAGHLEIAARIRSELFGRNVIEGRWTFQVVEEYDDGYHRAITDLEQLVRDRLVGGRRHLHEAEMKESQRTHGSPGHESRP